MCTLQIEYAGHFCLMMSQRIVLKGVSHIFLPVRGLGPWELIVSVSVGSSLPSVNCNIEFVFSCWGDWPVIIGPGKITIWKLVQIESIFGSLPSWGYWAILCSIMSSFCVGSVNSLRNYYMIILIFTLLMG